VQIGCLTVFFALAGVVVGTIVGVDLGRWVAGSLLGLGGGAVLGAAMGAVVAGATKLAATRAREAGPETVALGRREFYVNGQYVRREGPGPLMSAAQILRQTPALLVVDLRLSGGPGTDKTQRWEVVIPPELVDDVSAVLREESLRHGRQPDSV
jgi:hypothetical protein